ncbi:MAG: site-specific DNA-methyltransferase [Pseudomonadota bacterium]
MSNHSNNTPDTPMQGASLDIAEQRRRELKQLFPGAFTETRNDQGELVETLDFERLKAELGQFSEIYDNRRERYGMDWPGKRDCLRLIQAPSYATLKPCREESVDFDTTQNLFIEGDNLEVLKLLQKAYYGKIKMIYIDPPYNTGKEFIYPDNYSESLETYLAYAGLADAEGKKFSTNTQAEGRFHTKWLNMMYPRLYLARNLLKEDGVIFISIDDNEVENLRRMCDEIFGEENLLANFVWRTDGNFDNQAKIKNCHEYILCYVKNVESFPHPPKVDPNVSENSKLFKSEIRNTIVKNGPKNPPSKIELAIGFPSKFIDGVIEKRSDSWPHYLGNAKFANGKLLEPVTVYSGWSSKELLNEFIDNNFLPVSDGKGQETTFEITATGAIEAVKKRSDVKSHVISSLSGFGGSQKAGLEIQELGLVFDDYPKPTELLKYFVGMNDLEEFVVLDFFAGSCSTAHAVYRENAEAIGKNVSFIMIQLPEQCKEGSKAKESGYETISQLGKERVRKAGAKIKSNLLDEFHFSKGRNLDLGIKIFELNKSNFKLWQSPDKQVTDAVLIQQMELAIDHIDPNATQEDLLYELLLKSGVNPTETITTIELAGHKVFSVADGSLLVHLEDSIDKALIDAVLTQKPVQFICLDKAFHGNDQLKANAVKTFETYNQGVQGEELRIVFRTV